MPRYLALLRGINVGGRNRVAMADLRLIATDLGYTDVATYIQSGNLLFSSDDSAGPAGRPPDPPGNLHTADLDRYARTRPR